jgi:uncharacterized protein involved in exopolysaccharide biosynthesis
MTQPVLEDYMEVEEGIAPAEDAAPIRQIETLTEFAGQKWTVAKITLAFILVGFILCFALPTRYKATAVIMTPSQVPSISMLLNESGKGLGGLAAAASGSLGLRDPNAIFVGMLQSRTVADALISRFSLREVYGSKDMTGTRKKLDDRSDIKAEKTNLVSIAVTDSDPKRAADMANAYVEQLSSLTKSMGSSTAARQRQFYEGQLKTQRESLIAAEMTLRQVEQNGGLLQPTAQPAVMIQGMGLLRAQIAAKQVELEALRSFSTEQNSDVQLAERELAVMRQEASKMSTHGGSSDFADIGLKDIPGAGLEFLRAAREVQYQTTLYAALVKQYESFRLDEANDAYNIEVVDRAAIPDRHSSPRRSILMIIFTTVGFACSVLWVHYRKRWTKWSADPGFTGALQRLKSVITGK